MAKKKSKFAPLKPHFENGVTVMIPEGTPAKERADALTWQRNYAKKLNVGGRW